MNRDPSIPTTARIAILALLALSGSAAAAPGEDRFPISIAEAEARAQAHFDAADADESGSLNLAEFEAARAPTPEHRGMRRHGPRQPMRHHRHGNPEQRQAHRAALQTELFAILDADGSGQISAAEFQAGGTREVRELARKRAAFKRLDSDHDNLLTPAEMPSPAARLKKADADGDGLVTKDEMRAMRRGHKAVRSAG